MSPIRRVTQPELSSNLRQTMWRAADDFWRFPAICFTAIHLDRQGTNQAHYFAFLLFLTPFWINFARRTGQSLGFNLDLLRQHFHYFGIFHGESGQCVSYRGYDFRIVVWLAHRGTNTPCMVGTDFSACAVAWNISCSGTKVITVSLRVPLMLFNIDPGVTLPLHAFLRPIKWS